MKIIMLFYPSKANDRLNRKPFYPERVNRRVMLNPNYRIKKLLPNTLALCDSGAFQDIDAGVRLWQCYALERQLRFEEQLRWHNDMHDWHFEAIAIYDQMAGVDEAVVNGKKVKKRGTPETAAAAVQETLASAQYYHSKRDTIRGKIMFVGQGITPDQYINECVTPMLDVMQKGDYFAFGGFCILGRVRSLLPVFYETYARAVPLLKRHGVTRLHLLGICVPEAVTYAAEIARKEGVTVSTDSSAPEQAGTIAGCHYVEGRQIKRYTKEQKWVDYHPHDLAMENIERYTTWAATL